MSERERPNRFPTQLASKSLVRADIEALSTVFGLSDQAAIDLALGLGVSGREIESLRMTRLIRGRAYLTRRQAATLFYQEVLF